MSGTSKHAAVGACKTEEFHKLNVDCWEKIFHYLGLRDIVTMSKTCVRMRQIGGYYLNVYLPEVQSKWLGDRGLFIGYPSSVVGNELGAFMSKVSISGQLEHSLKSDAYSSLKTLALRNVEFTETQVNHVKDVLKNVECLDLRKCFVYEDDIHEKLFKHCPKLKSLILDEHMYENNENPQNFFQQTYPMLERFEYTHNNTAPVGNDLVSFLIRNPNIKYLGIDSRKLWMDRESLTNSDLQFDILNVHASYNFLEFDTTIGPFVRMLQTLHKQGFFKTLHLTMMHTDPDVDYQDVVEKLADINVIESLIIGRDLDISRFINLKELCLWTDVEDLESISINLQKLEKLFVYKAETDDILPFFQNSKQLKKMRIFKLQGGSHFKNGGINLSAMNEERIKLGATKKLTICVEEEIYLATKLNTMNSDLELVEIARAESTSLGALERCFYY